MKSVFIVSVSTLATLAACGSGPVRVRSTPEEALQAAAGRLSERGVSLDPAGRRPDMLRTERYCYVPPDAQGHDWNRSLTRPYAGPLVVTVEGDPAEQETARHRCEHLFRVELRAATSPEGETRLQATSEWWRLAQRHCEPLGNPLLGRQRCEYGYDGAMAPQAVEPHFHGMLTGL